MSSTGQSKPGQSEPGQDHPRYVVGVDGSEPSSAALQWAVTRAAETGAEVVAVAMWHYPAVGLERPSVGRKIHSETEDMVHKIVEDVKAAADSPDVNISSEVYQFPAADRLIDMSENADMVIVGRRSKRGLHSLGSVCERVASHAHCPVVVIPLSDA